MRRNILIIISFLTLLVASGCTNLDEKWYSEVTPDTYFTSKETVYSFLVRSFTHWRWFHGFDRAILQECTTDEMCVTQKGIHYNDVRYAQLQHHDWTPLHPNNEETWRGVGMGVAMALACKEDLAGVDYVSLGMTEELKADHQMQLQTLVAYFYLRGLDFYGGMPIYRRSTTEESPRSTARETFNYVEELLLAAIPKLEKKTADMLEEGYLRQGTAAALLAQLYFNAEVYTGESRFAECAQICQDLLDGKYGYYELEEDWFGPFTFENNKSKEVMWSVQSQYAKGTLFQWQFERYNHYNAKNYFDLSGYSSTNGMHLQPSLKPNGDPYTDKLGRPFAKFHAKDLRKKLYVYKGNGKYFNADGSVNPAGGPKGGMIRTEEDMNWVKAMMDAGYKFKPGNSIGKANIYYGDYIYADVNGDGVYGDSDDEEFQGRSKTPKYNFGFQASAAWNGFDISMVWAGAAGFDIYWGPTAGYNAAKTEWGNNIAQRIADDHYFYDPSNPDDPRTNINGKYPRMTYLDGNVQNNASSNRWLYNGDYIKLKNLSLGYTLPQKWVTKVAMQNARIYVSAENLLTITSFEGQDPESATGMGYAPFRSIAIGANITF